MDRLRRRTKTSSSLVAPLAIGGMLLAVLALGALAVWATLLSQEHSRGLSRAGVQTAGHLRATQALGQIDTHTDLLEDGWDPAIAADLQRARRVLLQSLRRMQSDSVVPAERQLARDVGPDVESLWVALDTYVETVRRTDGELPEGSAAEQGMEAILDELQLRFNDVGFDPSQPLAAETAAAAADERTIHRTALVLVPLGLLSVALCAWQLKAYRRRSEAERERLESELRLAQRLDAVGQLAAGIAHEINTPIQFVGDSVAFLKEAFADLRELDAEYKAICTELSDDPAVLARIEQAEDRADLEYLRERVPVAFERSQDGLRRVSAIVSAMRDFGRAPQVEHAPADLNGAIGSTLVVAQNEYKYIADVETELGDLPPVHCNVGELNQVFLNLIVNAAHAIAEEREGGQGRGRIDIRSGRENGTAIVSISDDGPGIPARVRERIFEPFFTTKDVGRGTGQGLAIARSIVVDKHGGTLTVDSEVGRGTTFTIALPIAAASASA